MAETEAVATPAASPKKTKTAKTKKAKTAPSHPPVADMVNSAISTLKERGGSSLQAIKKYVGSHYKVDVDKLAPFIKKYLKNAVTSGTLVQTKGKGASGSFRMQSQTKEKSSKPKAAKPAAAKKATKPKSPKKAAKPKSPKKAAKPKTPKKAATKPKAKSPKKSKAVKPKSPKPKKTAARKPAAKKAKK